MSQNFDLRSAPQAEDQGQKSQSSSSQAIRQWIPQQTTNRFPAPRIYEYGPQQVQEGDTANVGLSLVNVELASMLRIAFGSCVLPTRYFTVNPSSNLVSLTALVPNWQLTQTADGSRVPVFVVACNPSDGQEVLDSWFAGHIDYYISRKRSSAEFRVDYDALAKRTRSNEPIPDPTGAAAAAAAYMVPGYSGYYGLPPSPYMGIPAAPQQSSSQPSTRYDDPNVASAQMMGYPYRSTLGSESASGFGYGQPDLSQTLSTDMSSLGGAPPPHSSLESSTSSSYLLPQQQQQPPQQTSPHLQRHPGPPPHPSNVSQSSYIEPAVSAASQMLPGMGVMATTPSTSYYDPFANILNKANLRVEGNLDDMVQNWSAEEWENQRRLVRFWRRQEGNEVICSFAPVQLPPDKRQHPQNIIVVSCIYWKEKNDYFITSVDCIYLLESLIGVRFTVEEKNRIRRNLEGFRPLTVSKLKPDSAEFFKLIMGFPNPKPRNIEKDVKVFQWKSLGMALKKIISKYTASYSSTASVNLETLNATSSPGPSMSQPLPAASASTATATSAAPVSAAPTTTAQPTNQPTATSPQPAATTATTTTDENPPESSPS
ncbi:uncharacterized protein BYT42DRAFT_568732 [Radiomyces spectabilis]|uniref:uncharacterized protein n=1 Tax=Radiomyces spectabilis TaxID=64574 RepID=UPI00221EF9BF|nr:uncharacterized protein BYT42DRAFT_568732 [Radiomyces spectabilis]KAI8379422.1 hypothetical protein BYT42DRAFT_568732 [Radiomyces spectabilis]